MIEQLKEAIEWLGKKLENSASSPENKKLSLPQTTVLSNLMIRNLNNFILL